MNIRIEGPIREIEELSAKKGPWFKLTLDIDRTLLPINCFAAVAEKARQLRVGNMVRADCRVSGTEFRTPDGRTKRGVTLIVETLDQIPSYRKQVGQIRGKPAQRDWNRPGPLRPVPRNENNEPLDIGF
jgi:hypothetical protein